VSPVQLHVLNTLLHSMLLSVSAGHGWLVSISTHPGGLLHGLCTNATCQSHRQGRAQVSLAPALHHCQLHVLPLAQTAAHAAAV
jgi:hypothetical protein